MSWLIFDFFASVAMVNAWYIRNPPWKQIDREKTNAGQLAPDWQSIEERCREIIGWRMSLIPHLRAAFEKYRTEGTPPFRPLVLDFPEDTFLADVDDQFMVGERILVAPLFAGEVTRTVALPSTCDWQDFWTGKSHARGSRIALDKTYRNIPAFVPAGSVIPWASVKSCAAELQHQPIGRRSYSAGKVLESAG